MIRLFNKDNADAYVTLLSKLNISLDIYFNADLLASDAIIQQGEFEIFTWVEDTNYFIYPYIKIPFEFNGEQYFDLLAPYGYAGPVCSNKEFFGEAEKVFLQYIREQCNIVTEFVRYHYQYASTQKFEINILNEKNRDIVLLDLDNNWETILNQSFSSTARNLTRKMERQGYLFEVDHEFSGYDRFIDLYYSNMDHAAASDFYYFSKDYFYDLKKRLKGDLMLAHVKKDDVLYCSSLFFLQSGIITYYLSGRDVTYPNIPSNYFILSNVIKWGTENGYCLINFGGGRTTAADDSLFKFKSHFSKVNEGFYTGKRVHSEKIYAQLKEDFVSKNGKEAFEAKKHLLQFYR